MCVHMFVCYIYIYVESHRIEPALAMYDTLKVDLRKQNARTRTHIHTRDPRPPPPFSFFLSLLREKSVLHRWLRLKVENNVI